MSTQGTQTNPVLDLNDIFGGRRGGSFGPMELEAALEGFNQSLTLNKTDYNYVMRPIIAAMRRAVQQDQRSIKQATAADKMDALIYAKNLKNRYSQDRPLPPQIALNVLRLQNLANRAVDVNELRQRAALPVQDNYLLKAQTDNLKRLSQVLRNDKQIENQLTTLSILINQYTGNSREELKALLKTLMSRVTTAREDLEIQKESKKQNLVLNLALRKEKKEEKDKKLDAQRLGRRLAFTLNAE